MELFKKKRGTWDAYQQKFPALLTKRDVENRILKCDLEGGCLLCSEEKPQKCHRRLVAEFFNKKWPEIEIVHLV